MTLIAYHHDIGKFELIWLGAILTTTCKGGHYPRPSIAMVERSAAR